MKNFKLALKLTIILAGFALLLNVLPSCETPVKTDKVTAKEMFLAQTVQPDLYAGHDEKN